MSFFKAENLSIGYKNTALLSSINFELKPGILTCLLGSNGIGKSTLLRTISKLQPAVIGAATIDGVSIDAIIPQNYSKLVSMVLTHTDVNKDLTVLELVQLGRQPYTNWMDVLTTEDQQLIQETLIACDLVTLQHRKITQLSDGQLQRTFIARAVVQDTPFIFLDEPSTHLDLFHKVHLYKLLKDLCVTKNKSILFSTHDLDLALQLSDEIMLIKEGAFYHNTTNELINEGLFDRFFDTDAIIFDRDRKQFTIL